MNERQELSYEICEIMLNFVDEAQRADIQLQVNVVLNNYSIGKKENKKLPDVQKHITHFLAAKKVDGLSPKTIENYRQMLGSFEKQIQKSVTQINADDIRFYIVYLTDQRHLKEGSIQTHTNTLRSFFSWLLVEGAIRKNPMLKIRSQKIDKKRLRQALSTEEIEQLRDACETYREKALVEFLYSTGCRLSEVVGINLEDVNFLERSVKVCGKGDKERTVYFSVRAKLMLTEYLKSCPKAGSLFLASRQPYGRINSRSIQYLIQKLGERANLPRRLHPHLLRHTFATSALNAGMDITVIQALLGHSEIASTQIYASVSQSTVRYEYNRFVS